MSGPTDDQIQRARAWFTSEAVAKSIAEIEAGIEKDIAALEAAAQSFSNEAFNLPVGDDWAPVAALKHVVEWNMQVAEDILFVALTGARPNNPPPNLAPDRETLIAKHREAIDSLYAHVREAIPDAFLDVTWEHEFFGELNWREWFAFLRVHLKDHTAQLNQMRATIDA